MPLLAHAVELFATVLSRSLRLWASFLLLHCRLCCETPHNSSVFSIYSLAMQRGIWYSLLVHTVLQPCYLVHSTASVFNGGWFLMYSCTACTITSTIRHPQQESTHGSPIPVNTCNVDGNAHAAQALKIAHMCKVPSFSTRTLGLCCCCPGNLGCAWAVSSG